jgi:osmotically-inducible protein OsmY
MEQAMTRFSLSILFSSPEVTVGVQQQCARLSDEIIELVVKLRLRCAGLTQDNDIRVDAVDGVVELHGEVFSAAAKRLAGQIAWRVDDVLRVANQLEVVARFPCD